jgi:hypothetical protein
MWRVKSAAAFSGARNTTTTFFSLWLFSEGITILYEVAPGRINCWDKPVTMLPETLLTKWLNYSNLVYPGHYITGFPDRRQESLSFPSPPLDTSDPGFQFFGVKDRG